MPSLFNEEASGGAVAGFAWTESALAKHSRTTHAKHQERLKWEAQFTEAELQNAIQRERQRFITEILSKLQSITAAQISGRVGISRAYASLVKKGLNVPHPCLYSKFEECCMLIERVDPCEIVSG